MKAILGTLFWRLFLILFLFAGTSLNDAFAQAGGGGDSLVPTVTVVATDPIASLSGNPGKFTVFRKGNTNLTLNVWYELGGTASNGVDYILVPPHLVLLAAGETSASIVITPLANPSPSNAVKTVVLQLTNSPLLNPVNYEIGSPSSATVYIEGNGVTNLPPLVNLISPTEGAVFYTPTNIQLLAKAGDLDGTVASVEFFAGSTDLGQGFPVVLDPPGVNGVVGLVYFLTWNNPAAGKYALTAVATDDDGAATTSDPVHIFVLTGPPTNKPPVVRITSPANGSVFRAPIDLSIFAYANDPDSPVTSVEFFADSTSLGFGKRVTVVPPPLPPGPVQPPIVIFMPTNYWELTWSNAPVGGHVLTAVASDDDGTTSISPPVKTAILPPLPPPTNRPPIVSIVATDPVAIEGTNGWIWKGETNVTPTWAAWPTAVCRPFTNCGPKNAVFTVRRCGDTNDDLTVNYAIGGSASNGVDYVGLSGVTTIPAGKISTMIAVVPLDDGAPDVNKTVILTLLPDMRMNPLPGYVLGFPQRAAAIILDGVGPYPVTGMLSCGCFHLVKPGPDAAWFCIEYSTNLKDWTPVCTNQVVNGSIDFVDPDAAGSPGRFYRILPVLVAP